MLYNIRKSIVKPLIESIPGLHSFLTAMSMKFFMWHRGRMKDDQYPKALKRWYSRATGETLDLENPQTFDEKIQWLKLYDCTPVKTVLADKYKVRQWVAEKIGDEYLIPLLGKWENANDIDFSALPDRFAMKANHGCGWNIIVTDKSELDIKKTRKKLNDWLKLNWAFYSYELHYKHIPPVIIAEKYIENMDGDINDYKFHCFNGEPKYCQVIVGRRSHHMRSAVDLNFQPLPFALGAYPPVDDLQTARPENYDHMITLARTLCEGLKYVRVDFYNVRGKIYFGEMTVTPTAGTLKIRPREYEKVLGDWLTL